MSINNSILKQRFSQFLIAILLILIAQQGLEAQSKNHLRLTLGAGISQPHREFNATNMFAQRGVLYNGSLDYFINKFGIGIDVGYFTNDTKTAFQDFIHTRYLNSTEFPNMNRWETKYALLGPTYNFNIKRFQIGIFVKAGYSQISVPQLGFNRAFFGQTYNVYQFYGDTPDYQMAWMGGINLGFKVNNWLAIIGRTSYFTTSYLSKIDHTTVYRDATDSNRNNIMEDNEYLESRKKTSSGSIALTTINPTIGIQISLGKSDTKTPTSMTSELLPIMDSTTDSELVDTDLSNVQGMDTIPELVDQVVYESKEDLVIATKNDSISTINNDVLSEIVKEEVNKPIINIAAADSVNNKSDLDDKKFDAPESKYDEEAAGLLYKAGESFFATNDFESAIPCFNKLKANPQYPRAAYMFALSMSAMGNCAEAKSEYDKFNADYSGEDKRTLAIIFASQLERCKDKPSENLNNNIKTSSVTKKYTIQFIAIKKPNQSFPNLSSIGNIETEFFPNKSVYRYVLGEYSDLKSARADADKVKKMGFRDAFIAEYEDDKRVNTLDHFVK